MFHFNALANKLPLRPFGNDDDFGIVGLGGSLDIVKLIYVVEVVLCTC